MLNRIILIGRLTSQPELQNTGSGIAYTKICLAVNRAFTNESGERQTDFINVVVWRKQAENVCQYLNKGSQVAVEGSITTNKYTDKDGNNRTSFEVSAQNVSFLENKKSEQHSEETNIQEEQTTNPYEEYGNSIEIDDNFLD